MQIVFILCAEVLRCMFYIWNSICGPLNYIVYFQKQLPDTVDIPFTLE